MDEKIELYEKILDKYKCSDYGSFLSTDDIKFDFKTETVFITKDEVAYIIFIEENDHLYMFRSRFEYNNKNIGCIRFLRSKCQNGSIRYYRPDEAAEKPLNEFNKFDFIKENFSDIIKQIKSERILFLLSEREAIN